MKLLSHTHDGCYQTVVLEHEPAKVPEKGDWTRYYVLRDWIEANHADVVVCMTLSDIEYGVTQTTIRYGCDCDRCQCWGVGSCSGGDGDDDDDDEYDPEDI